MRSLSLANRDGEVVHKSGSSTGSGNKQTITKSKYGNFMLLSAKTNNARVTFDGTDPGAAVPPGLIVIAGAQPVFLPFATDIEFVSEAAAAASELNVLYLE